MDRVARVGRCGQVGRDTPMRFVNLTPHVVRLNDGREFPPTGMVVRTQETYGPPDQDGVMVATPSALENLPPCSYSDVRYIVSRVVLSAVDGDRRDLVAPATGHPETERNAWGEVQSVPGFIQIRIAREEE